VRLGLGARRGFKVLALFMADMHLPVFELIKRDANERVLAATSTSLAANIHLIGDKIATLTEVVCVDKCKK
jgi:hypothetical protein